MPGAAHEKPAKVRVLAVDDHPFFRSGLVQWLNQQSDFICCGEADSVASARQALQQCQADIVLLDLRLPDGEGLDLLREICDFHPRIRVVVLSQMDEEVFAPRCLRAGARGYVMKSESTQVLAEALRTVLGGAVYVSRAINARFLGLLFPDPRIDEPALASLSDRELQVFQLLGTGYSTLQIAEHLKISPKTVETHREHLKTKLRLPDGHALSLASRKWVETGRF
jgi:DNA-binding NarL/FixJ family response regulator